MLRKKEIAMVTFINVPFVIDALNPLHVWQCQEMLVHHSYIPGCPKQTLNIPFPVADSAFVCTRTKWQEWNLTESLEAPESFSAQ